MCGAWSRVAGHTAGCSHPYQTKGPMLGSTKPSTGKSHLVYVVSDAWCDWAVHTWQCCTRERQEPRGKRQEVEKGKGLRPNHLISGGITWGLRPQPVFSSTSGVAVFRCCDGLELEGISSGRRHESCH